MTQEIMMVVEQPRPIVMQTTEFVRGGGSYDYDALTNKPSINGVTLEGDKSTAELGLPSTAADVGAVAANQGSENAGKFLVVGNTGEIETVALDTWQGGSF